MSKYGIASHHVSKHGVVASSSSGALFLTLVQNKAIDKWVLGGAEAPPNFWYLYLKDIAHSHSTQLLIMCSES